MPEGDFHPFVQFYKTSCACRRTDRRRPAGKSNAPPEADLANRAREPPRSTRLGKHPAAAGGTPALPAAAMGSRISWFPSYS